MRILFFLTILSLAAFARAAPQMCYARSSLLDFADLLQAEYTSGLILDLFSESDHRLRGPATFVECPGPHEEVYDIDLDDCYTEPEDVRKGGDVTLIVWGVMTEDAFVDNLHMANQLKEIFFVFLFI